MTFRCEHAAQSLDKCALAGPRRPREPNPKGENGAAQLPRPLGAVWIDVAKLGRMFHQLVRRRAVSGARCAACGVWFDVCDMWCLVGGRWYVVCGVWCVS